MSIDTLLVIGCGLIGSSIARAAKVYEQAKTVYVADRASSVCTAVERLGFADGVSENAPEFYASKADLIILCVPPGQMGSVAKAVIPVMKPGAILSDVGSVKGDVIKQVSPYLSDDIHFIPGHPIAGTEFSGPEAGFAEIFRERWCVLTPIMGSDEKAVGTLAVDMETVTNNEVVKFSAGGFRDFTRIAASDPVMWRDVFLSNREATLEVVDRFIEDLSALKRAIRWQDGDALLEHFAKTRDIRRRIVDAGQDSSEANFGRDES